MPDEDRPTTDDAQRQLTWAALLARWTEMAKSAVALPTEGEGGRYRRAVAPAIGLQAVTNALGEIDRVDPQERAFAIDRAEVSIRTHASELHEIWSGQDLPPTVRELIEDAADALELALEAGAEWLVESDTLVGPHPGALGEMLIGLGFNGDALVPSPGVPLFRGAPAIFAKDRAGGQPEDESLAALMAFARSLEGDAGEPALVPYGRQVYRQFDFAKGGPVRDLIAPLNADLPPGQPLLVPIVRAGELCPVPLPPRSRQVIGPLPVEFAEGEETQGQSPAG